MPGPWQFAAFGHRIIVFLVLQQWFRIHFLLLNKVVSIGLFGFQDFFVCCRFLQANIFHYGVVEKNGILCDVHLFAEGEGADSLISIPSRQISRVDIVETWNKIGECFSAPPGLLRQYPGSISVETRGRLSIGERDLAESDLAL